MSGRRLAIIAAIALSAACGDSSAPLGAAGPGLPDKVELCDVPGLELTASGVAKDAIPALSNPSFVSPGAPGATHLLPDAQVIGLQLNGEALAVPLSIMWWHEIVNLDRLGVRVAVTYCPLTGTAMAFDRAGLSGRELGVSGILLENNLVMYDRTADESLWGQMVGGAICGSAKGKELERLPVLVATYEGWQSLHPDTKVLSSDTGFDRNYEVNPYEDYERLDAPPLYETENNRDRRRLPKERVLGIPSEAGGLAIPFQVLESEERVALNLSVGSREVAVLWDRMLQAVAAYDPVPIWADGYAPPLSGGLTFERFGDGYRDTQTGSSWNIEGAAVSGPAMGSRLTRLADPLVAYWFAWATFNPGTEILTEL